MTGDERPTGVALRFGVLDVGRELGEDVVSSCVRLSLLGGEFGIPEQGGGAQSETQAQRPKEKHLDSINTWTGDSEHVTH